MASATAAATAGPLGRGGSAAAAGVAAAAVAAVATGAFPYGVRARKLIDDLKRSDWIPPYDAEGVLAVLDECDELHDEIRAVSPPDQNADALKSDFGLLSTVLTLHHAVARNKRCLLAYHQHRLEALQALYWDTGKPVLDRAHAEKLSEAEMDFYGEYQTLMSQFAHDADMDLLLHMDPPKDLVVEVRALCDYGEVVTEFGSVLLTKDATHFMRRVDAEPLIRQNVLEQI